MTADERVVAITSFQSMGWTKAQIVEELETTDGALRAFASRFDIIGLSNGIIRAPLEYVDETPPETWAPSSNPRTLEQNKGCCWPVNTPDGQRYCGLPKHNKSYCEKHHAVAYAGDANLEEMIDE